MSSFNTSAIYPTKEIWTKAKSLYEKDHGIGSYTELETSFFACKDHCGGIYGRLFWEYLCKAGFNFEK